MTHSPYEEKAEMVQKILGKGTSKKKKNMFGYRGACISKDD